MRKEHTALPRMAYCKDGVTCVEIPMALPKSKQPWFASCMSHSRYRACEGAKMRNAPTYYDIANRSRRTRKPLGLKYSPQGVWYKAELNVDELSGKVKEIDVVFKYYAESVDTGEAEYCYVRIGGIEFRHWPYNREEWHLSSWECQSSLEEDGATALEVSDFIDQRIDVPDEILVQVVDSSISKLVAKKVALDSFKAKAKEHVASFYLKEKSNAVYLLGAGSEKINNKLKKVTPKTALDVVWSTIPVECTGAC